MSAVIHHRLTTNNDLTRNPSYDKPTTTNGD